MKNIILILIPFRSSNVKYVLIIEYPFHHIYRLNGGKRNEKDNRSTYIYFNDDLFPIRKLRESEFCTENKPHIKFLAPERCPSNNIFRLQCRSSLDFITKINGKTRVLKESILLFTALPIATIFSIGKFKIFE